MKFLILSLLFTQFVTSTPIPSDSDANNSIHHHHHKSHKSHHKSNSTGFTLTNSTSFFNLDVTELVNANPLNWDKTSGGKGLKSVVKDPNGSGSVLKVDYLAGSYASNSGKSAGGMGVYASPRSIFPAKSVRFLYDIYFPSNFIPVKGGKLPGLYIGKKGASGGNHIPDGASCRLMWRAGLRAEAYIYVLKPQDPSYDSIPNIYYNPTHGDSIWRGSLNFKAGEWNTVDMTLTVNTFSNNQANADGKLSLTINGVTMSFDKFIWATIPSAGVITGIEWQTFFGGGSIDFATPVDTSVYFKNVQIKKL